MSNKTERGTVKLIYDVQEFKNDFKKREFILTTEGEYKQDIRFSTIKDKCSLLDGLNISDKVDVHFDLRGNEYNGKYYVNLEAWKIEKV